MYSNKKRERKLNNKLLYLNKGNIIEFVYFF